MEVVEDFESIPHKAVIYLLDRDKGIQEVRELKLAKLCQVTSGGKMPGRSKAEGESKKRNGHGM